GAGTALVTPFTRSGDGDEAALRKLVRRQVQEGIDVLVPCGTTGEAVTMTDAEQKRVVAITLEEAGGKPVIAGAGSKDTRVAVEKAREMAALGAHGVLSVGPYYNKPTPEGFFRHFSAVAEASTAPVVIYNVPGRPSQHHGREGGLGQPGADHGDPARPPGGLPGAVGRRRVHAGPHGPRGRRCDLGGRQPGAGPDARAVREGGRGRLRGRPRHPQPPPQAHEPELRGVEPHSGEDVAGHDGPLRGQLPPAHGAGVRGHARGPEEGAGRAGSAPVSGDLRPRLERWSGVRAEDLGDEARRDFADLLSALESGDVRAASPGAE